MVISGDIQKLINDINVYSDKPIKNLFEASVIIELALSSGKKKILRI